MQLCTPNATLHAPRPKLHTRDLTLLTSHSTRYPDTSHFTLHTILYALNFPLYTPNSSLHTPHIGRATLHASHVRDFPDFSHVGATKSACSYKFLMNPKICHLKIGVSCEASVNFHHMSQSAMYAT